MKISGSSDVANYVKNGALTETGAPFNLSPSAENPQPEKEVTRVSLSQKSKDILKTLDHIAQLSDIRKEKVELIKDRLREGVYRVRLDDVADRMLQSFNDQLKRLR